MRTEVMRDGSGLPYVEHYSAEGGTPRKTPFERFPIIVGRDESSDLHVDSGRISREHAQFEREAGAIILRDLGSTNGTFVNGHRIDQVTLEDGDIVLFADVEFTFYSGSAGAARATATQIIDGDPLSCRLLSDPAAIVHEVRRLQELLAHHAVQSRFQPIVDLADGKVFGYQAIETLPGTGPTHAALNELLHGVECQLGDRLRQVLRMAAVADAARWPSDAYLFLDVHPAELGGEWLVNSIHRLRRAAGPLRRLAIEVPESVASDATYFHQLHARLKLMNIAVSYADFASGRARVLEHRELAPDFLKLDPSVVRYIDRSKRRQSQVQSLAEACGDLGIALIAEGIRTQAEAELLRELGCAHGQGRLYGSVQTIEELEATCAA